MFYDIVSIKNIFSLDKVGIRILRKMLNPEDAMRMRNNKTSTAI